MKKWIVASLLALIPVTAYLQNAGYLDNGNSTSQRIANTDICVPGGAVEQLTAPPPHAYMKGQKNAPGGLLPFGFTLSGEQLHQTITRYQPTPDINGKPHYAALHISIEHPPQGGIPVGKLTDYRPSDIPELFWKSEDDFYWEVAEEKDGAATYWGFCTKLTTTLDSCKRRLPFAGMLFRYELAPTNLALHREIDAALITQLNAWKCKK